MRLPFVASGEHCGQAVFEQGIHNIDAVHQPRWVRDD
jgi:hypothetical protein